MLWALLEPREAVCRPQKAPQEASITISFGAMAVVGLRFTIFSFPHLSRKTVPRDTLKHTQDSAAGQTPCRCHLGYWKCSSTLNFPCGLAVLDRLS